MIRRYWRFLSIIAVITMAFSVILGCAPQQAQPTTTTRAKTGVIKIGVLGPMKFLSGDHQCKGAELAAEQINAAGGFMVGDTKCTFEPIKIDDNIFVSTPDAAAAT